MTRQSVTASARAIPSTSTGRRRRPDSRDAIRVLAVRDIPGRGALAPSPVVFDAPLDDNEARIAIGEELVAYTTRPGDEWQLTTRTRSQGEWGPPAVLLRAPTGTLVMGPSFSPDGRRIYFESNHRVPAVPGRDDSDVWPPTVGERLGASGAWSGVCHHLQRVLADRRRPGQPMCELGSP